ncbi:uncharacterized protein L969DRAFT_609411 [Mixia osmundae IAM 14324]|uniref:Kri1-like C-terminal domain-containing protein n=1 Tax=Mixia osmundae (strain CBS 9802 / IAM 14324 / JCM 22182 / KY 12970) TaxID=764103 RepID=G7DWF9_MIXOS|nr:uncharacterized protein L969DRAFT_609411 [Mixia osmundae IAM 14324]KEI37321.1 hypothetical protein L969DRAFT_609411 [Mixia osmundae IAM 14324]GAA94919.1 hypothetical protein E5Q_01574 [Mixia osmundae IAM 14324]
MDLFDEPEASTSTHTNGFKLNSNYAEQYERRKRGEELTQLQDRYGRDYVPEDEESTEYSSEDSDAELVTPQVDAAILKTIARIKRGDTALYDDASKTKRWFEEEEQRNAQSAARTSKGKQKAKESKPVYLKDFQRQAILAAGNGDAEDVHERPTPAEEAVRLQRETADAFRNALNDDADSDEDVLLVQREDTEAGEEDEDEAYRRFLLESVGEADVEAALRSASDASKSLDAMPVASTSKVKRVRDKKNVARPEKPAEDPDAFLRNYILDRGWLDKSSRKLPSYSEMVEEPARKAPVELEDPVPPQTRVDEAFDSEDEEYEERADEYETKYNFRFEQEAGADLVTHARDAAANASVRREDETRKKSRELVKARKAELKAKKAAELDRLRDLKSREIQDKLAKLAETMGRQDLLQTDIDLEGEFDPDKHDQMMQRIFDEQYYADQATDADGKPIWEDDIDITDIVGEEQAADYEPGGDAYDPLEPSSGKKKEKKKRKDKKSKKRAREAEEAEENVDVDPAERKRQLDKLVQEYDKLNYGDLAGTTPTRFHYTQVPPSGFDLTPAEILMATDQELNSYVGLRKIAPYRFDDDTKKSKKKRLRDLRKNLSSREWGAQVPQDADLPVYPRKSKRPKLEKSDKRSQKPNQDVNGDTTIGAEQVASEPTAAPAKKRAGKSERKKAKLQSATAIAEV